MAMDQKRFLTICACGVPEQIEEILKTEFSLDKLDMPQLALIQAAQNNLNENALRTLLKYGHKWINETSAIGWTALSYAARYNTSKVVKALLEAGANALHKNKDGLIPLVLSIKNPNRNVFELLTLNKRSLAEKDNEGRTVLHHAAESAIDSRMIDILVAAGSVIEERDNKGMTPLMLAAKAGKVHNIEALIKAGAAVDSTTENGITALMYAAKSGNEFAVEKLIKAGANVNAQDKEGLTPLIWASRESNAEHLYAVRTLIASGADVAHVTSDGSTAITYVAGQGSAAVMSEFLRLGADVESENDAGITPALASAAREDDEALAVIACLQEADVDFQAFNKKFGMTALGVAIIAASEQDQSTLSEKRVKIIEKLLPVSDVNVVVDLRSHADEIWSDGETDELFAEKAEQIFGSPISSLKNLYEHLGILKMMATHSVLDWAVIQSGKTELLKTLLTYARERFSEAVMAKSCWLSTRIKASIQNVELLLQSGAEPMTEVCPNEPYLFWIVVGCKDPRIIQLLLNNVRTKTGDKNTAERLALLPGILAWCENKSTWELVLAFCADLGFDIIKAMYAAIWLGDNELLKSVITNSRVNINEPLEDGSNAIAEASKTASAEKVSTLLSAGVNPKNLNNDGESALFALFAPDEALDDNNQDEKTALVLHYLKFRIEQTRTPENIAETAKLLIENDCPISITNKDSQTVLMIAAGCRGADLALPVLAQSGALEHLTAKDCNGKTALMYAAEKGSIENLEFLLDAASRMDEAERMHFINAQDNQGRTALLLAVTREDASPFVKALLAAGALPDVPNNEGVTPLAYAVKAGSIDLVTLLSNAGAQLNKIPNNADALISESVIQESKQKKETNNAFEQISGASMMPALASDANLIMQKKILTVARPEMNSQAITQKSQEETASADFDAVDATVSNAEFKEDLETELTRERSICESIDFVLTKWKEAKESITEKSDEIKIKLKLSRYILETLRRVRKIKKQVDLADACQIDTSSMSRYLNGERVLTLKLAVVIALLYLNKDDAMKYLRFIAEINSRGGKKKEELLSRVKEFLKTLAAGDPSEKDLESRKAFLVNLGLLKPNNFIRKKVRLHMAVSSGL